MGIVVIGVAFVDIKGFPDDSYIPNGRNAGRVEYVHGGVARNVVEDIANVELRPTFIGTVDDSPMGQDVLNKLKRHKVNCDYVLTIPDGLGLWLAVFDDHGDVAGSISKRVNAYQLVDLLETKGDEIFADADSIVLQVDLHKDIVKKVFELAERHGKKIYALVSNMSIAVERRDFLQKFDCFICNQQEAGLLFLDNYEGKTAEEMQEILSERVMSAQIPSMIVTMGGDGAVFASSNGDKGYCPALSVQVKDTTGAGDSFCAGVAIGLTYGKTLEEAVRIGNRLAASVITSSENVCPRFQPAEFGIEVDTLAEN